MLSPNAKTLCWFDSYRYCLRDICKSYLCDQLLHLLPVDELDASITDYYSRASPRSASLASPSAVSATGSGILPRQTNSNEVSPSSLKNADGWSMAWLKNALAVDDGTTRRWGRRYHSNYHHHHQQPQQPQQPAHDGNGTVGISKLQVFVLYNIYIEQHWTALNRR